jgi:S1-C subfamily serine protease
MALMEVNSMMYTNRPGNGLFKTIITSLLTTLGAVAILFFLFSGNITKNNPQQLSPQNTDQGAAAVTPAPQQLSENVPAGASVAEKVASTASPGVVGITVERVKSTSIFDRNASTTYGDGSGVIATENGLIVTNNHVAGGVSKRIVVSLADGRNVDGITLWSDPVLDLAIVKVNLQDLKTIPLGDANSLKVGEPAIAIGNPLGLQFQRTVTSGIISALNRTIQIDTEQGTNFMEDLIQTDASINPGNSGGPLLNSKGEVVGINTIKVTSAEAIGFAIPINMIKPILAQILNKGSYTEPYLGIFAYDKETVPYIDPSLQFDNGIYVANVDAGGPAAKAGVKVGCIIGKVDGKNVNTMMDLRSYLYTKQPGDSITIKHYSKDTGKWTDIVVQLAAKQKDGLITR